MEAKLLSSATIGKTHGLSGYLKLYSLSGEYSHLKKLKECVLRLSDGSEGSFIISDIKATNNQYLIRFSGYENPESAKKLSKATLLIPRSAAPRLKKGEYYIADLYDMDVLSSGEKIGRVVSTVEGGQALLLEIEKLSDGKAYLVPLLPVYIANVNVSENTLELLMPELLG